MQRNFCSQCGQPIELNANFCTRCGADLRVVRTQQQLDEQSPNLPRSVPGIKTPPPPQPSTASASNVSASAAPSSDIIPRRHLIPRAKLLFFFNYIFITSILLPFMVAFLFFDFIFAAMLIVSYFVICYIAAMITYNCFYFSIDQNGFEKDYGVFFKKHVSIPFEQIQNVNTTRTILDRIIGIARLDIETAGSASTKKKEVVAGARSLSEGHLPGISPADARNYHDLLLRKVKE